MYENDVLAIVPIKTNNLRFPNKHFECCGEYNLLDRVLKQVGNLFQCSLVVSNSYFVALICQIRGIAFVQRPIGLEEENIGILSTIKWINESISDGYYGKFEKQVLLQATNPCRTDGDITLCVEALNCYTSSCTVVNVGEFHPNRMYVMGEGNILYHFMKNDEWMPTQNLSKVCLRDGGVYAWNVKEMKRLNYTTFIIPQCYGIEIPMERSIRIDTREDLERAKIYFLKSYKNT